MIMGIPDGSKGAALVSNDARPCTPHTTSYSILLEEGYRCRLWDTRGLDEAASAHGFMAKIVDKIRQLASQQASELKETIRNRIKLASPILMWCIDASKVDVEVQWHQFRKVYVDYCERKAIPVVVITRGSSKEVGWETKCTDQLRQLDLGAGVDVPFTMMRKYRNPSSREYGEDCKALKDFIKGLMRLHLIPARTEAPTAEIPGTEAEGSEA